MLYKISLEPYLEDSYYGIFLDRRNQDIDFVRKTCVLILKEKNLEKIFNKRKVCKEDLFLNPIMFLEPEYYQKDDLPWEFIINLEMDVSIIENWAFKSEQVPFPAKGILFNLPWRLSLSDSKMVFDLKYSSS
jgi:hypothetical protein